MMRRLAAGLAGAVAASLVACGGDSSSTPSSPTPPSQPTPPPSSPGSTAPTITTQPANVSVTAGQTATFSVVASGSGILSYQWSKSGSSIPGATSASYTTPVTTTGDSGSTFVVVVTNTEGSIASNAATLTVTAAPPGSPSGADVVTFKNDVGRTGQNLKETILTPANVNSTSFGLLRMLAVDGKVDAQPLYLSQLTVGSAVHNTVFVATEHASVYAFDADTGAKLWQVSLLKSGETTSDTHGCGQVTPEIGITSTPVIDRSAGSHGVLYVVAMSIDGSSNYHQRLHALDVTTGAELFSGPTDITATFPNAAGTTTFSPGQYEERAALLLANGLIYTAWTSHCDNAPYSGWMIAFNQTTLARTSAVNVAPNSGASASGSHNNYDINGPAIWMSGDGPGADAAGNVYFLTGNGRFETTQDANGFPSQGDYGNSFVKVSNTGGVLAVADYFAMSNEVSESQADKDLGSGGEMLLPDLTDSGNTVRHLVVGAGKDGNIYVVNRDNMGKFNSSSNNIWQEVDGALGGSVFSSPAWFNGTVYYAAAGSTLRAFPVSAAKLATSASSQTKSSSTTGFGGSFTYPGASPAISANGTSNGIVWAHENTNQAVLHAFDATNLANELYSSNTASGGRDQFGAGNKFITPMISGGKVFVGTQNAVAVFGLLH